MLALAGIGEIDAAANLWAEVSRISQDIPKHLSENMKDVLRSRTKEGLERAEGRMIYNLRFLDIDEINKIYGYDVRKDKRMRPYVPDELR